MYILLKISLTICTYSDIVFSDKGKQICAKDKKKPSAMVKSAGNTLKLKALWYVSCRSGKPTPQYANSSYHRKSFNAIDISVDCFPKHIIQKQLLKTIFVCSHIEKRI